MLLRRLASQADVVIENFKAGGLRPYGLDYESLRAINPRLIYCSITGFGHTGPYASRPGYDFLIQAHGRADEHHRTQGRRARAQGRRRWAWRSPTS